MIQHQPFLRRYTCGQHVSGRGRQIATRSGAQVPRSSGGEQVIGRGVVVMLPSKSGDPYTVLDEETFIVLEAREEDLVALP